MKTRVNLSIEEDVLNRIKIYAQKKQTTISNLAEEYFANLTKPIPKKSLLSIVEEHPKVSFPESLDLQRRVL